MSSEKSDQILDVIGDFGKWQAFAVLNTLPVYVIFQWYIVATPFLSLQGDFWCKSGANNRSFNSPDILNSTSLKQNESQDSCFYYDQDTESASKCQEFGYDFTNFESSIVTDFNLVCENEYLVALSQSIYMLGVSVGYVGAGIVADKFGRKICLIAFMLANTICNGIMAFSPDIITYIILRTVASGCQTACVTISYVLVMEVIGGKWKGLFGAGTYLPYAVGYMTLPLFSYFLRNWRHLQLAITLVPAMLPFIYIFTLSESPRWLLSQGKVEEAQKVLEKANITNNRSKSATDIILEPTGSSAEQNASFLDLLKTPNLRKNTLVQFFNFFTCGSVYYTLTFDDGDLIPGNIYLNALVSGATEIPTFFLSYIVLQYFGRKKPVVGLFALIGVAFIASFLVENPIAKMALTLFGKFGINCAYVIVEIQAAEIYPTVLRSTGWGACSAVGSFGTILAPILSHQLAKLHQSAIIIVFASFAILAAFLSLLLPNTGPGVSVPDTIEEGENLGKNEDSFGFLGCKRGATS